MKAKYWLIGGISSIALAYFLNHYYQSFLSKNFSADSFDFATAQNYEYWIETLSSLGWIALIIGAILVVSQKSARRWHRWYRLAAAGILASVVWSIVGVYVQTFTGDVLFGLGYQKPSNLGSSRLEQLFQANNWEGALHYDEIVRLQADQPALKDILAVWQSGDIEQTLSRDRSLQSKVIELR